MAPSAPHTIFITGATDGIGLALARLYAKQGHRVLTLGRRPLADLDDPLFTPETYCRADLTTADAAQQVQTFLQRNDVGHIDVLVHNAGLGYYGRSADQSATSIDALLAVNVAAPIRLTHALLPWLPNPGGQLVFISSVATNMPTPDYAVYGATKAALEGFARSLRVELGHAYTVQVIQPGATRTGMHAKANIPREVMDWQKFPPAEKAAAQIAQAIARKRPFAVIGLPNKLLRLAARTAPRLFDHFLQRKKVDDSPTPNYPTTQSPNYPTCAITGAADGIGRALALRFARAGYRVVGIDVDAARAAETEADLAAQGANGRFIIADLTTEEGLAHAAAELAAEQHLHVLVHNAGISAVGRFDHQPLPPQEKVLRLNLWAPLRLTAVLLRQKTIHPATSLVFLSSLSRFVSYPGAAVYAATKDGQATYARSLRADLGRGAHTLTVYPGPTRTAHARRYSPDNSRESRRMPPAALADAIFAAVEAQQSVLIPGLGNRLFATFGRLLPRLAETAMRKTLLEKMES